MSLRHMENPHFLRADNETCAGSAFIFQSGQDDGDGEQVSLGIHIKLSAQQIGQCLYGGETKTVSFCMAGGISPDKTFCEFIGG